MKSFLFLFIGVLCVREIYLCEVKTRQGLVSGVKQKSSEGKPFWAFKGIPYAEPPIGHLRFNNAPPKKPWKNILKATNDRDGCLQINNGVVRGSEDCLYLNVYTPKLHPKILLPVMVYLHDGSFVRGNGNETSVGPAFMMNHEVVTVSINYRLGVFGFLATGDKAAPGNWGLKDQVLALKWIQANILQFGGNPKKVTLVGDGSGGESAHLMTVIEKCRGLFSKVIAQSGNVLSPQLFTNDPSYYQLPKKIAEKFHCPTPVSESLVQCLRRIDSTKLIKEALSVFDELYIALGFTWRAVKEPAGPDALLTDTPANLIKNNRMKDCPTILGTVVDEGTNFARQLKKNKKLYDRCVKHTEAVIKSMLELYEPLRGMNLDELSKKMKKYYLGDKDHLNEEEFIAKFTKFTTDLISSYSQSQLLNYIRNDNQKSPCYSYLFSYRGELSEAIPIGGELGKNGVAHGDDLFYLLNRSSRFIGAQYDIKRSEKDKKMVGLMCDLWSSFVNSSEPISHRLENPKLWQPLENDGASLKIGNGRETKCVLQKEFEYARIHFWYENVPRYSLKSCDD